MTQANDDNPVLTNSKCRRCAHFLECAACGVTNSEGDLCQKFSTAACDSCVRLTSCNEDVKGQGICTKFETRLTISEDHTRLQFSCDQSYLHSNWIDASDWKLEPEYLEKIAVVLHVRVQDVIAAKTAFDDRNSQAAQPSTENTKVTEFYCSKCLESLEVKSGPDSLGTIFYACKNGHETTNKAEEDAKNGIALPEIRIYTVDQKSYSENLRARLAEECKPENIKKLIEKGHRQSNVETTEKALSLHEVGDTFRYKGDKPFEGRIQVTALSNPQSRYSEFTFSCPSNRKCCVECELDSRHLSIKYDEPCLFNGKEIDTASSFATYFDTNNPKDALAVLLERGIVANCGAWKNSMSCIGAEERAVTQAIVMDPTATEGRAWFVHNSNCDLKRAPNWIFAQGWMCKGQKGRIGILVQSFKHESEITAPDQETVINARTLLQKSTSHEEPTIFKIANALRKRSNLKGEETTRGYKADLLTISAPVWTKTPEGPPMLSMTSLEIGVTTSAKSQREREIIKWLGVGKYEAGKKTAAGLAAGVDKIEGMGFVVRKGLLPSADLSFLIVDNSPPHALDEWIESRRNGVVAVSTIRSLELWARTRLKLLSNPLSSFDEHFQKCAVLKMFDDKLIARFTFAILTYGVDIDTRYKPTIEVTTKEEEDLLNATRVILRWNLSQETTYTVPDDLWPLIMEFSKNLELKFGNEEIPLFLRSNPQKIATLSYCFALFEGTEPNVKHVQQAYNWMLECGQDMELDDFSSQWKQEKHLSDVEFTQIKEWIESKISDEVKESGGERRDTIIFRFFEIISKSGQPIQMEEVAAQTQVSNETVKRRAKELKGLGLIKSGIKGYSLTPKGVRFLKRYFNEIKQNTDPDDLNDTNFKAKGTSTNPAPTLETFQKLKNSVSLQTENTEVIKNNINENSKGISNIPEKAVPLFPAVPSEPQLVVKTDDNKLKRLEVTASVYQNRFCGSDCGSYSKPSCPLFTNKIPKDTPMPLRCYGWKPPAPTDNTGEASSFV